MPDGADLGSVQQAIGQARARWTAGPTPLLSLSPADRQLRLGVNVDLDDLAAARLQPAPDLESLFVRAILDPAAREREDAVAAARRIIAATSELQQLTANFPGARVISVPLWWWAVDWRHHSGLNAVTPVRDQGLCKACIAFGTIAALESMLIVERQITLELSEAELLFCGGGSCGGWWLGPAISYLTSQGVAQASCFPYHPMDVPCNPSPRRDAGAIKITTDTVVFDAGQRKQYLAWVGPMIAMLAVHDDFFAYAGGVYTHLTGELIGYHCVEVIGYDDVGGYWICKNSWGTNWGEAGFFRIAYGECEIDSTFPFHGISGTQFWT